MLFCVLGSPRSGYVFDDFKKTIERPETSTLRRPPVTPKVHHQSKPRVLSSPETSINNATQIEKADNIETIFTPSVVGLFARSV